MKKWHITLATIIICCVFLWIGFYGWFATKSVLSDTKKSDRDSDCLSMYPIVKEYITDHYESSPIEWIDLSHSTVWDIDLRYNSDIGGCYASTTVNYMDYVYTDIEPTYNLTKTQLLFSIWDNIEVIYRCDYLWDKSKDCRNDFNIKVLELKKSS